MAEKYWKDVLAWLVKSGKDEFTAHGITSEFDMSYPSASQMLGRLQAWGYLRLTGFERGVQKNPKKRGGGRTCKVYEVTENGHKKVKWEQRKKR